MSEENNSPSIEQKIRWLVQSVANIGVDFGYGPFELNDEHVEVARQIFDIIEKSPQSLKFDEL